jgi:hypothetical protein
MEDTEMKKEYIKPAMLLVLMNTRQQMLAGSVTSVTTTNLDPVINYKPTDPGVDPWDEAQSREMTFDEEEEDDFEDDIV